MNVLCVLAAMMAVVTASYPSLTTKAGVLSSQTDSQQRDVSPREYNFIYGVNDPVVKSLFGHQEFSNGKSVAGSYHVRLPDGRHQTVIYQDDGSGFMADVSYDMIARHLGYNLYFESTQEPVTVPKFIIPSRELEPPPREQPKVQPFFSYSSTDSPVTSAIYTIQETTTLPSFKATSNSFSDSTGKARFKDITGTLKNPLAKATGAATDSNSTELTKVSTRSVIRDQRAPTTNKTQNKTGTISGKTQQQIPKVTILQKDNANSTKLAHNKSDETIIKKQQTATKKTNTTTEKFISETATEPGVDNFADTIFRGDFPTPINEMISPLMTTEKHRIKTTHKQPSSKLKETHANKITITKSTTAVPNKPTLLPETSTLKSTSAAHTITTEADTNTTSKGTKAPTFRPVPTPAKETSSFKPHTAPTKSKAPPKWKAIENVTNGTSIKQAVTKKPTVNGTRPTFASTTKRPLTIFELLDKFKPLSFRTLGKFNQRTIVKRSNSEELLRKTIKTDLFKNFPGNPSRIAEIKMEERMHTLKEIKNDPVFKNFAKAQRYRMVQVTLPPIKKVRHHEESIKHAHVNHAIKHPPSYSPPPTTEPSAYADRPYSMNKFRVTSQ